jgi:HK97 gp10 family phage protein
MTNNPSVKQFRTDMQTLAAKMKLDTHALILAQADELIANMKTVVPVKSGALRDSLRKKDITQKYGNREVVSVLVIGGGPKTTRRTSTGHVYDYAVATEFGTAKEAPEPFFYSSYRAYKSRATQEFQETVDDTIAENNKVRSLRSDNYSDGSGFSVQSGYRGAVVLKK